MVERMRHGSNHRGNENENDDVESSNGISISSSISSDKELNGGLLVVCPSQTLSAQIQSALQAFALAHSHSHPPPSPSPPASPSPLTESKENGKKKKKKKKKPHHHLLLPFAEQSLLSRLFPRRWAPLPYAYNALKTLRWRGVHDGLWRDGEVRCVHYILTPKPWEREGRGEREKEKGGGGGGGEGGEEREERERNGYGERSREESEEEGMGDNGVVPAVVVEDDEVTYGWWDEVDAERRRWEREAGIEADGW